MKKIKTVTVVSLSRGILGESFVRHELDIGVKRLTDMGLEVRFPSTVSAAWSTSNSTRRPGPGICWTLLKATRI